MSVNFALNFELYNPYYLVLRINQRIKKMEYAGQLFLSFVYEVFILTFQCGISVYLLGKTINGIIDFLHIKKLLKESSKLSDVIQLQKFFDYNNYRFINKHYMIDKKFSMNSFNTFNYRIFSFNIYLSIVFYSLNILNFALFLKTLLLKQFIEQNLRISLIINLFISCSEIDSLFDTSRQYKIFQDLFNQYSKTLLFMILGFVILFIGSSLFFYNIYNYYDRFDGLIDSLTVVFALMMCDNVLTIFDLLRGWLGHVLIYLTVVLFNMTFMEILMNIVSVSYQRSKEDFQVYKQQKKLELKQQIKTDKKLMVKFQ